MVKRLSVAGLALCATLAAANGLPRQVNVMNIEIEGVRLGMSDQAALQALKARGYTLINEKEMCSGVNPASGKTYCGIISGEHPQRGAVAVVTFPKSTRLEEGQADVRLVIHYPKGDAKSVTLEAIKRFGTPTGVLGKLGDPESLHQWCAIPNTRGNLPCDKNNPRLSMSDGEIWLVMPEKYAL